MKRELILFGAITFLILDVHKDGKYSKKIKMYKKHFKIVMILFFGLSMHLFMKKHPQHSYSTVSHMNGMIRHLPINKDSADLITPIISMAATNSNTLPKEMSPQEKRMLNSGTSEKTNGRSVSGTKKKYIAAQQGWKCGHCGKQLDAWFEVDHKMRLEHGGSNHVTNLIALCRNCHGEKTTLETL
jgi:predicted restriction endonuclease